jgi:SPP1 gp7 family putative phage head morphogenesis protein
MAKPTPSTDPARFEQAIASHRKRVPMRKDEWRDLDAGEREKAFTVADVARVSVIADAWKAMDSAIENGTTFEDFKASVGEKLESEWGKPNAPRLSTIFRTNIMNAYAAGRSQVYTAPAVKRARPYLRFDAIKDDAIDEECDAADGTILPQDDPFWASCTPPLHFNCRCVLTPLSQEDANEEGGVDDEAPDVEAAEGFGRAPSEKGTDWEPTIGDFPAPLGEVLNDKLSR